MFANNKKINLAILAILIAMVGCARAKAKSGVEKPAGDEPAAAPVLHKNTQGSPGDASGYDYFPIRQKGKVGYMSLDGDLVISPQFDEGSYFFEGYATVKIGGFWSFLSPDGTLGERFDFGWVGTLSEGLAPFRYEKRWYGYINPSGDILIRELKAAKPFSEGYAAVQTAKDSTYIDKTGRLTFGERYFWRTHSFLHGLGVVYDNRLFGVVEMKGNYIIEPKQLWLLPQFSEGLCGVRLEGDGRYPFDDDKLGYIDTTGKTVIDGRFSSGRDFHEGAARGVHPGCQVSKLA